MRSHLSRTLIASLVVFAAQGVINAGDLEPPGPVAPTDRHSIFQANMPLVISTPGSYVVKENLTGVAAEHGIEITTNGVTIDLGGFELVGVPGSLSGIYCANCENITVKNGIVRSWGGSGVELQQGPNLVSGVHAWNNVVNGIEVDVASVVTECTANGNDADGIQVGLGSIVTRSTSRLNNLDGIRGTTSRITIRDNVSVQNGNDGIQVSSESFVTGNTCGSNGFNAADGAAIHVTSVDNRIEGNHVTSSDRGIDVDAAGNLIIRNSASGNTTNYDIVGGNDVGPIGTAAASASPWANIAF